MSKTDEFRILGRRPGNEESIRFEYRGVVFDQDAFHVVAGLNAVDTREYVEQTFAALKDAGQRARAWAPTSRARAPTRSRATAGSACPTSSSWPASTTSA